MGTSTSTSTAAAAAAASSSLDGQRKAGASTTIHGTRFVYDSRVVFALLDTVKTLTDTERRYVRVLYSL